MGGLSGACVSVCHITTAPDGNNNKYMCQKGESDGAKGMLGGKRLPCFVGSSHKGRVRKCYGNVIGFEDFGYMEM